MKRPYIICYMMTSVDGRIDCNMTAKLAGVEDYYPLLSELNLESAVSGRTTAKLELSEEGEFESAGCTPIGQEVVSKKVDSTNGYNVVTDSRGTLLWKDDNEYDQPHVILLSEQASAEYLAYLDSKNISYIVCGEKHVDLVRAADVLGEAFGIERLGVVGGPTINTAFLDAGLLDEIIILIGAGIDGRASFPPVFNSINESRSVIGLRTKEVKQFPSGAVMIRYLTR